jgi:hypothetical protein
MNAETQSDKKQNYFVYHPAKIEIFKNFEGKFIGKILSDREESNSISINTGPFNCFYLSAVSTSKPPLQKNYLSCLREA